MFFFLPRFFFLIRLDFVESGQKKNIAKSRRKSNSTEGLNFDVDNSRLLALL